MCDFFLTNDKCLKTDHGDTLYCEFTKKNHWAICFKPVNFMVSELYLNKIFLSLSWGECLWFCTKWTCPVSSHVLFHRVRKLSLKVPKCKITLNGGKQKVNNPEISDALEWHGQVPQVFLFPMYFYVTCRSLQAKSGKTDKTIPKTDFFPLSESFKHVC